MIMNNHLKEIGMNTYKFHKQTRSFYVQNNGLHTKLLLTILLSESITKVKKKTPSIWWIRNIWQRETEREWEQEREKACENLSLS